MFYAFVLAIGSAEGVFECILHSPIIVPTIKATPLKRPSLKSKRKRV